LITAELRGSRQFCQFYESPPESFTFVGFDTLPPSYHFLSLNDLIEFTLTLFHVTTGLGGAAFEADVASEALTGKRYAEGNESAVVYRGSRDAVVRLQNRAQVHGGLFWVSESRVGLIRFSPAEAGFTPAPLEWWSGEWRRRYAAACKAAHLPGDDDMERLVDEIRMRTVGLSPAAVLDVTGDDPPSAVEPEGEGFEAPAFGGDEAAEDFAAEARRAAWVAQEWRRPPREGGNWPAPAQWECPPAVAGRFGCIETPVRRVAPVPRAMPRPTVGAPTGGFLGAVDAILRRGGDFSVEAATAELQQTYGGSKWSLCLDTIEAVGWLCTRP
jgi:hypothetical protein